jgi:putative two-component system response regulator
VVAIVAARTPAPLVLALRGQPCSARILAVSGHVIDDLIAEAPEVIVLEAEPERFDAPAHHRVPASLTASLRAARHRVIHGDPGTARRPPTPDHRPLRARIWLTEI